MGVVRVWVINLSARQELAVTPQYLPRGAAVPPDRLWAVSAGLSPQQSLQCRSLVPSRSARETCKIPTPLQTQVSH